MNRLYPYLLTACLLLAACNDDGVEMPGGNTGTPDNGSDTSGLTGYADPAGVMLLSAGTYTQENAFLTFVRPDGEVENDVFAAVNGTDLGNDGVGLCLSDGKQYILCNDWRQAEGKANNGLLTVADARTLVKECSFPREDMVFRHPVNDALEEVDENLSGIAVLDERNVFLFAQGVLRFDCTTGKLTLVEGAYEIGNAGSANTVESVVSSRGATVMNGRLYAAAGGFWTTTALLEFVKGKDEVNRRLELGKGDLVSGLCRMDDNTLLVATYTRGRDVGYLYVVSLDNWTIREQKTISANISPAAGQNSGITYLDGYLYFTGAEETAFTTAAYTTLSRYSMESGRVEKDLVDFKTDAPNANVLDCNIVADPQSGYVYVPTSDALWEGQVPESVVLVYDCNGDTPRLVKKISGLTHGVSGIYPMSQFVQAAEDGRNLRQGQL